MTGSIPTPPSLPAVVRGSSGDWRPQPWGLRSCNPSIMGSPGGDWTCGAASGQAARRPVVALISSDSDSAPDQRLLFAENTTSWDWAALETRPGEQGLQDQQDMRNAGNEELRWISLTKATLKPESGPSSPSEGWVRGVWNILSVTGCRSVLSDFVPS